MATKQSIKADAGYPIGVVSRLTGIHPETLRMWERRYGVVRPSRSGGRSRRYSDDEIRRLALVKALVDAGDQISIVAPMTMEQLKLRAVAISPAAVRADMGETRMCRVFVLGSALPERLKAANGQALGLEVAGTFQDEEALLADGASVKPDALILEFATVQRKTLGKVRQLLSASGASRAVVIYGFGARQALRDLEMAGVVCLRAPAELAELQVACHGASAPVQSPAARRDTRMDEEIPAPRFTPDQLAQIAVRAPVIACECPHHLVDLINAMAAFETYSRECQNENVADAEIHALLYSTAGRARAMLEVALQRVAEFEGIELT